MICIRSKSCKKPAEPLCPHRLPHVCTTASRKCPYDGALVRCKPVGNSTALTGSAANTSTFPDSGFRIAGALEGRE